MARDTRRGGKKKVSKNIAAGVAHVNSSFNNTKILISDVQEMQSHGPLREQWALKDRANRPVRGANGGRRCWSESAGSWRKNA